MRQTVLTFISKVKLEEIHTLRVLLQSIRDEPANNAVLPFGKLKGLHFASFILHEPTKEEEKKKYGPYLIFENNFDGALDHYLDDLCDKVEPGLLQIYKCCEDFFTNEGIWSYLKKHVVTPNAYHIGNTGRSVERILLERDLKGSLETRADELLGQETLPIDALFEKMKDLIQQRLRLRQLAAPGPRQSILQHFLAWINLVLQFGLATVLIILVFPVAIVLAIVLLHKEKTDSVKCTAADDANVRRLVEDEDHTHVVQNHMASITIVKDGWLRRLVLWVVLWAINLLARANATHGKLSGISSIHFAHWSMIDKGRRLLFLSNFDGSWENYLDDFIDKAHAGLTAVWSNTVDFPRTRCLYKGGATDGPRFKAVARDSQTITNAWYSAYPKLTVQAIDNNSSILEEYFDQRTTSAGWLQRL
jgi:hypothetical protein